MSSPPAPDALADALKRVKEARQIAAEHATRLRELANIVVNNWRNALIPLLKEYNGALRPFSVSLAEPVSDFGRDGSASESKLTVSLTGFGANGRVKTLSSLCLPLTADARLSIEVGKERVFVQEFGADWPDDKSFPEDQFRRLLAELIEACLTPKSPNT